MKPLDNSNICIDKKGRIGIIGSILGSTAQFHVFDADGNTGEATPTPVADLTLAPIDGIPASRRAALSDEQWLELGHTLAPVPVVFSKRASIAE